MIARAIRNPYVAGIVLTVLGALGAAAAGASDVVVVTLGLGGLAAILGTQWITARNNERTLELTVDQAKERRIQRVLELDAKHQELERVPQPLPPGAAGTQS